MRAQHCWGLSHADLVSHPDCHRGLEDSAFLVKILPCVFWEGESGREDALSLERTGALTYELPTAGSPGAHRGRNLSCTAKQDWAWM